MAVKTKALPMDARPHPAQTKDVCYACHQVVTLERPTVTIPYTAFQSAPGYMLSIEGMGPFDIDVHTDVSVLQQIVNIYISRPDIDVIRGGIILKLGFNQRIETAVFCTWQCVQAGVQQWLLE